MIDHKAAVLALRARAEATVVATTGTMALAATADGYTRASGSFIDDGFVVGMEFTPSGFGANAIDVVLGVSALTLTTKTAHAVEVSAAGRSLVVNIPLKRAWENIHFERTAGRPYIVEQFDPQSNRLLTTMPVGGTTQEEGRYYLTWYGLEAYGMEAIRAGVDALRARFTPGTSIAVGSHALLVPSTRSTQSGQIIPGGDGWARCTLSVPWFAFSTNAIAA